jgi:hypothetical protein
VGCRDCGLIYVGTNQDRALLDLLLPTIRLGALESSLVERPGDPSSNVTGRLAQARRQRTVRHDWPDSGKHERDRRKQVPAQLTQPGRSPRVFDF